MQDTNMPKDGATPQPRLSFDQNSEQQHTRRPVSEFDPCANAKITSPFYLYNHDSPRPSHDGKLRAPVNVAVRDLEAGDLSPSISQEKQGSIDSGRINLWSRWGRKKGPRCRTERKVSWFSKLPPWQRLLIKLVIGLVLAGIIVGVAVGISIRVNGGVYKSDSQTTEIGD